MTEEFFEVKVEKEAGSQGIRTLVKPTRSQTTFCVSHPAIALPLLHSLAQRPPTSALSLKIGNVFLGLSAR
jgi:hypothetical protein